jgi:hypothetical protein
VSILHVANGHATTGLIELSGLPGRTQIWADPLNEGPVPGNVSNDELLMIRARFLASQDDASDIADDLRRWRDAVDDADRYDELVLWFEHDLFDQLNLIQLLAHLDGTPRSKPITLISIDWYPGRQDFKGLGELEPRDLAALFTDRRPVDAAQFALAGRAWAAYRSPDPRAIEELLKGDTSALPFLGAALARHLEEFPSEADGLSRSERRLMELAMAGPADLSAAFPRMHHGETAYYIADSWFVDRARELASVSPALVDLSMTLDQSNALPAGTIALTHAGREVLGGAADRVELCGIDRWLGGVHLQGRCALWRWNPTKQRIVLA